MATAPEQYDLTETKDVLELIDYIGERFIELVINDEDGFELMEDGAALVSDQELISKINEAREGLANVGKELQDLSRKEVIQLAIGRLQAADSIMDQLEE